MSEARIMIVEDERIVAEDIKEGLQNLGYAVTSVAGSGEVAIKPVFERYEKTTTLHADLSCN